MKVSVIAWDCSFREKFHTIDSFCKQDYPNIDFEFIWVDFYSNSNPELLKKIALYENASLLNLNNDKKTKWHLGKCINAGVKQAKGALLVFPDGDIVVQKDHLSTIRDVLENREDLVVYFRRWDELQASHGEKSYSESYLEEHTKLLNATNYAGCFALHRTAFETINGYEESDVFAGPGANGRETYLRLRNAGYAIQWHNKKIFHPWHPSTGSSDKYTEKLKEVAKHYSWVKPYSGLFQSWVLKQRELDLSYKASEGQVKQYLENIPDVMAVLENDKSTKKLKSKLKKLIR
ncbi:hypothetical protein DMZ43_11125 [Meridianimaribacter sp. CL38]|uniref:glycosyltransferase n=1 Tax=Meridianimaribacter sp. CL38 TaxID=2213021 RepID=UPI00103FA9DA|nr:glycosyltransferase family A protein [Meridianimaribacter sp. CL38]TBV25491.1 hypothetical protein DMZ43_11125 [Meridianimaribacter sp. CL38]